MAVTIDPATSAPSHRRRAYALGAVVTAVAVGGALWAALKGGGGDKSQLDSLGYVAGACLIVGAALFGWLVPSRIKAAGTGLPFAIVSVPLLYAFWSGIPLLVAAAAILVGAAHRGAAGARRGRALAAILIGALVALLTIAAILIG